MVKHRAKFRAACLAGALHLVCFPSLSQGVDLPLGSPVYRVLDRLWAEGCAGTYWPDRLPVTQLEASAILEDAQPRWLGYLSQGSADARLTLGAGWTREGFVGDNRQGLPAVRGAQGGAQITVRDPIGARIAILFPDTEGGLARAAEAYAVLGSGPFRLTVGRESLWWGPGRRGDLLLTDNARAPDMVRLENSPGFVLPGFLEAAGEWRVSLFVGRVGKERPPGSVGDPVFGGMKVSASPHPNLVLSVSRTFLYGGKGKDEDLGAFFDALLAREADEWNSNVVGNQIAGISAIWRIPSGTLPVVLYAQAAGEDEANRQPSKWGFLAGFYLPRLGSWRLADLRFEATTTDMPGQESVWYEHPDYPYVSDGRILGHPAGNDAHDLTVEVGLFPSAGGWFGLSATRTVRGVSGPQESSRNAVGVRGAWSRGPAAYTLEWRTEGGDDAAGLGQEGTVWSTTVQVRL